MWEIGIYTYISVLKFLKGLRLRSLNFARQHLYCSIPDPLTDE